MSDRKLDMLREDLQVAIIKIEAVAGNLLIIHPKDEKMQFTPQYTQWLGETLQSVILPGVQAIIISDALTEFDVVQPTTDQFSDREIQRVYVQGWNDAIKAIRDAYSKAPDPETTTVAHT